jgi:hypothetical protein
MGYSCGEWFGGRLPGVVDAASDFVHQMMPATLSSGIMLREDNAGILDDVR